MNLTRKDFFKQGMFSLGEAIFTVTGAVAPLPAIEPEQQHETAFVPVRRDNLVATARNEQCLARNCGCFACIERCESRAIHMVLGTGIRIDEEQCIGCGSCEHLCPITPKAVSLIPRNKGR